MKFHPLTQMKNKEIFNKFLNKLSESEKILMNIMKIRLLKIYIKLKIMLIFKRFVYNNKIQKSF